MTEREAVDAIREKLSAVGGHVFEINFDDTRIVGKKNDIVVIWKDGIVYEVCLYGFDGPPPNEIVLFRRLRFLDIDQHRGDLSWLEQMESVGHIFIEARSNFHLECLPTKSLTLQYYTNRAFTIPPEIRNYKQLEYLSVMTGYGIAAAIPLPEWLHELPNLKTLNLSHGNIHSIPYSVVQLGLPFVTDNAIAGNCVNLTGVTLEEGDITLFDQPREVIEAFYRDKLLDEFRECKVIFLGDGAAGKSSLIDRIVNNRYAPGTLPTDGVKLTKWQTFIGDKPATLRFLDFGGQEIMHSMHRCFLTAHTVYVVVCESRDDAEIDRTAARWMETVQSFAPGCPVILALNKSDLNPNVGVNTRDLRAVNPSLKLVLHTSAAVDGDPGVQQLVEAIYREVPGCLSRMSGNAGMLGLKRELEQMQDQDRDYILPDEFAGLCEHYRIAENLRLGVLGWFQDLGVAYTYAAVLREVHVLNPAWLTNGIYRLILRAPNNGFLHHQTIRDTLKTPHPRDIDPDKVYTERETEFVLYVMRKFEISLEVRGGDDPIEMIPMKMGKTPPDRIDAFPRADALHLRWERGTCPTIWCTG